MKRRAEFSGYDIRHLGAVLDVDVPRTNPANYQASTTNRGVLLDFVRNGRKERSVLAGPAKAEKDPVPQTAALTLRDGIHTTANVNLTSGIRGVKIGHQRRVGYGRSKADWTDYVGDLTGALRAQERQDLEADTRVVEVVRRGYECDGLILRPDDVVVAGYTVDMSEE